MRFGFRSASLLATTTLALIAASSLVASSASSSSSSSGLGYFLSSAKFAVSTVDGSSRISKAFSTSARYEETKSPFDLSLPTQLENDDVLRLTFNLGIQDLSKPSEDDNQSGLGKQHVPHQAFVVLSEKANDNQSIETHARHAWPVSVKTSGKVSWNLRMDRIPASFVGSSSPLTLSLLISNFPSSSDASGYYHPLHLPLISLTLPSTFQNAEKEFQSSRQRAQLEQGFKGWPENHHTFSLPPTATMPSQSLSSLASLIVMVIPWIFFLSSITILKPTLTRPTLQIVLLYICLIGLDLLAIRYWLQMTLFTLLPILIPFGLVTLFLGRSALSQVRFKRLSTLSSSSSST